VTPFRATTARPSGPPDPRPAAESLDEGRDYAVRTLPVLLWLTLLGSLASATLALASGHSITAAGIVAGAALIGAALLLARRGRARLATGLFIGDGLLLTTFLLWTGDGLKDVAVMVYPVILIVGAMLLEGRAFAALLGLCLGSLLPVAAARDAAQRGPALVATDVLYLAIILSVTAAAVWLLASALRRSLREARTSERALRASEASFTKAFHSSPVIMVITSLEDARVLDVNDAFGAATGYAREDVMGRPTFEVPVFVDLAEPRAIRDAMLARGAVRGEPLRLLSRSGETLWTLVSGESIELDSRNCALYVVTDITARKRAEDALAASEERYRLISEVSSDYTFSNRLREDGRFHLEWVAGAFERITGYDLEEYEARGGWTATLHPDDVERDARDLAEIHANQPVVSEVRIITRSGDVRSVRVYAHPVWNEAEDRLAGLYGAVQDVTEERQAVAEREALLRELEAKNAELERFSYTVSHDLKTPLITVQSFVGFLEADAASGNLERLRADVGRIRAATEKMLRMLNELLELSRVGRVTSVTTEVRFADLVQDALALVRGGLDQRGVVVDVARELPVVRGDRGRLLLVLQNLLDNAVKFMGAREQPRVEIGARRQGGRTVFYVRDNGIGIEPRHHDRVFGLFEKLDPASGGTGLGLALVRRIVETHQGRIWVESQGEGHGATFCFTLGDAAAGRDADGWYPPRQELQG
jgi:PAS domain S-box-containing protein